MLSAFSPFATDTYLPAFPRIAKDLGTSIGMVQLTLAIFLVGLGVGQVFWGTLSDRVGRRIPLILGCVIFGITAMVCATTHNIHTLIAVRFLAGFGGSAGVAVSRAIVRDLFEQKEAARFYTMMMAVIGIAPIVAPVMGSMLLSYFSWRIIFWTLAVIGVLCVAEAVLNCPETLTLGKRMSGDIGEVFRGYHRVLTNRRFLGSAMTLGCTQGMFFTYIVSSSHLFIEVFGIPVTVFGFLFSTTSIGLYIGIQSNRWLLRRFTSERLLRNALWVNLGATILLSGCAWAGLGGFKLFFAVLFVCIVTLGIIFPNATAIAMQPFPNEAGRASSMLGIFQYGVGGISGSLVGLCQNGSALPVTLQILCLGLAAQGILLLTKKRA